MKNAKINERLQPLFDEYKEKILNQPYFPSTPSETLMTRLTAVWLLENEDQLLADKAEKVIQQTSVNKKEDVLRLKKFSEQVKSWDDFQICSAYNNDLGLFIEYQLETTTIRDTKEINHYHALFQRVDDQCFFISQSPPLIRVIGDPILHKPGVLFPQNPTIEQQNELTNQIEHAKNILIQTGGAGIAANQCAQISEPFQFTIVGVFHNDPVHIAGVTRRYPTAKFPKARIMVNPTIISSSKTTQNFNHACLSVPCPNRCSVRSPEALTVEYLDPTNNMEVVQLTLSGVDAVVLWHELTHILDGKTYIDAVFEQLTTPDLYKFETLLRNEQSSREKNNAIIRELTVPPFYFTVTSFEDGSSQLDEEALIEVLGKMTDETLSGLLTRCQYIIHYTNEF